MDSVETLHTLFRDDLECDMNKWVARQLFYKILKAAGIPTAVNVATAEAPGSTTTVHESNDGVDVSVLLRTTILRVQCVTTTSTYVVLHSLIPRPGGSYAEFNTSYKTIFHLREEI